MKKFLKNIPWSVLIIASLTIGLTPFAPPHIWGKLQLLFTGKLVQPLDWFDFALHGAPWGLLITKSILTFKDR